MILVDTHTHLYAEEFDTDRRQLIEKAMQLGVQRFYLPNIDSASIAPMMELEELYPEQCLAMMGLHPCHVKANVHEELAIAENWLKQRRFVAIGEIGLDLYWDKSFLKEQELAFKTQIKWALEYKYPIVIHCREAFDEIYAILKSFESLPKAIFHCFSGTAEQAQKILDLGTFKLGIGGVLTFKNAGLDKVVEQVDLSHLVLETDAPYLAPVPFRGKRNEPAYMLEVAKKLAALKNCSMAELCEVTTANAKWVFGD